MKLDVFDTYVTHEDGKRVHFDVLLPNGSSQQQAQQFAIQWMQEVGMETARVQLDSCRFCHSQEAYTEQEQSVKTRGYAVIQMEGCPAPVY